MGGDNKKAIVGGKEGWNVTVSSPYYLGSGDQPGHLIIHVIFSGDNYVAWVRAMTISLRARRKIGFIDGTIPKPTEQDGILDWDMVHSMLVSWILRSMEPKIASTVPLNDNAQELWDYLEQRFCVANGPRIQQIRAAITECKQTSGMSIDAYCTKLTGLYDELARLKPTPSCECKKCDCGLMLKLSQNRDEEIFHQFLVGVDNGTYGTVRTNLLSQQPLGDLNRAYQTLVQEDQSRALARSKPAHESVQAFHVQSDRGKGRYDRVDKSKLMCSHCKQRGHEVSGCFKLHGNPPWYEERNRARNAARAGTGSSADNSSGSNMARGAGGPKPIRCRT